MLCIYTYKYRSYKNIALIAPKFRPHSKYIDESSCTKTHYCEKCCPTSHASTTSQP